MKSILPFRNWWRARKSTRKSSKKPMFPKRYPTFEQLEVRFMPSAVTLGLYNDTSIGAKFTSDGRLQGTISDPGYSVATKTVTFSGGVTGTTTTDANGYFLYTPTLSSQGAYNSIVASFTDHTSTGINSPSYSFTYDTVAPSVTLTAPGTTSAANFTVTVSATDTNSLPDGTIVRIDVDLNNNGSFTNAGEQNYVSGILTSGSATITISPPLAAGTYPLRARVIDQAGNVGTSSTQTTVVSAWATSGQQRVNDPAQSTLYAFGQTAILPNTGSFLLSRGLDFDLSPGTSVGGNPALVYDSSTVNPKPIIEATLDSDPSGSVPTNISVQLTWNGGTPQTAVNFATTGHSAGDVYLLDAQVATAVTSTGAYSWSLSITETFSGSPNKNQTVTGTAYVVVSSSTNPFLLGWSMAGVDNLTTISGGVIWVSSSGGFRVFTGSSPYTSPANDFGSLVQNVGGSFTYTSKDGWTENFNSSGQETSLVDPHSVKTTYTYSSGLLANVSTPDGAVVTLSYGFDMQGHQRINTITAAGSRTVSTIRNSNNVLTGITDAAGGENFTYDGSNRLINDLIHDGAGFDRNATFTYDTNTGALASVDRGLGSTLNLAPAISQGLATSPAKNANQALAVITDALTQLATYSLDSTGRLLKLQTPDGGTQAYQLDQAGQPVNFTDPLNRVTSYQYQYGSGKGDVKQITKPDASTVELQYEGTFHHVKQIQDTLNRLAAMTYDGSTGDLLTATNPLNQTTTQTWSNGLLQTVTDRLSHTTTLQYDTNRRLQVIQDALNDLTTLTYDSSGNLSTTKNALGKVTTTVYDGANRLTQVTDAAGSLWTYSYNPASALTVKTDPRGNSISLNYDARGFQTAESDAYSNMLQQTTTSAYDVLGRITTQADGLNHVTTLSYDPVGRLLTTKSPIGGVDTYTYDLAGELTAHADGAGHTTSYSYSARGWITQVQDALNNYTTMTYDTEGNVLSVKDARGNSTTLTYDALNRPVTVKDALSDVTTLVYDAAGNRITVSDARGNTVTASYDALNRSIAMTDALNHTVTAVYDAVGNVIRTLDALGNSTTMSYDALNRRVSLQDPGGGVYTTAYDAVSNVVNTVDALNHKSTFVYDALNREITATDPRGAVTTTAYDAANNVTSVTDPVGNTTSFSYDSANRLTQQTDPLGHSGTYSYDLANRLTSTTDRDGRRIDNTFDADNRLTQANWVISGSTVNTLTYSYDANSNLLTAANNAGTYTMTYDALNRVSQTQEPFGLTLTATYDAVGNRTQLQDSFGGVLTSIYDSANRLTTREFGGASQTPLREDLTYTARDQIATETRYSDLAGTTKVGSTTFTYDTVGRLSNLQHLNATGTSLANYTYGYDQASRLQTEQLNGGGVKTYTYDAANELTSDGTNNYSYDLNGNRTMTGYSTGTGNQLTNDGTWTYSYDSEGNLTKKSRGASAETWTYGYDNANHMIWAKDSATDGGTLTTLATYVYDALGNRVEKDVWTQTSGTTTVTRFGYDGNEVWVDLNGSNALQTRYIHGDGVDELFARISSGGTAAWYLTDRLGSIRDIINSSGTVIDHLDYDPFGNIANETNSINGDRYKWTGREFDAETGLQYNRARYYHAKVGRWTSQDPVGFAAGDGDLYRYVNNESMNALDPSGLAGSSWTPITLLQRLKEYKAAQELLEEASKVEGGKAIAILKATTDQLRKELQGRQGFWRGKTKGIEINLIVLSDTIETEEQALGVLLFELLRAANKKRHEDLINKIVANQLTEDEFALEAAKLGYDLIKKHHTLIQNAIKVGANWEGADKFKASVEAWDTFLEKFREGNTDHEDLERQMYRAIKRWKEEQDKQEKRRGK